MSFKIPSIITMAVVSTSLFATTAQAENDMFNWYGSIRVQLEDSSTSNIEYKDNYSRVGVKGSSEIFDGITASYRLELRLFSDSGEFAGSRSTRLSNVSIAGDFGQFTLGKQYSPYWLFASDTIDDFSDLDESGGSTPGSGGISHTHRFGLTAKDAAGNKHYVGFLRPERSVSYTTPEISGFTGAMLLVLNNGDVKSNAIGDDAEEILGYNLAAKYQFDDFRVAITRYDLTGFVGDNYVDAMQLTYNNNNLTLAARYQMAKDLRFYPGMPATTSGEIIGETVKEVVNQVYAGYQLDKLKFQIAYSTINMESASLATVDTDQWLFETIYQHKHGAFYLEYTLWGSEAKTTFEASNKIVFGYKYNF